MRQHFLYGLRLLRKSPAFAVTSILIVALGVGATTAIFSVVYGVMLRPLPFRDPGRLVSLWTISPKLNLARVQVNGADRRDWQARNHVLTEIALVRAVASFNLTGEGEPERLFAALADGGQVQMPMSKTFFSSRFGMVTDRFGVPWMVIVAT